MQHRIVVGSYISRTGESLAAARPGSTVPFPPRDWGIAETCAGVTTALLLANRIWMIRTALASKGVATLIP